MYSKNFLISLIYLSITLNLVLSSVIGDVSISPFRYSLKKRLQGPSIRPFLNEQNLKTNLEYTKSLLQSTTPSSIQPVDSINELKKPFSQFTVNEIKRNKFFDDSKRLSRKEKSRDAFVKTEFKPKDVEKLDLKIGQNLNVVTYSPLEDDMNNIKKMFDQMALDDARKKLDREIERVTNTNGQMNKIKDYEQINKKRPYRTDEYERFNEINPINPIYPLPQFKPGKQVNNVPQYLEDLAEKNKTVTLIDSKASKPISIEPIGPYDIINPIHSINKTKPTIKKPKIIYRTKIVNVKGSSNFNKENYPIIKFVNQYKCDLNVSTCGLWNDPQLKDMFYLENMQDIYTKQRCYVADTYRVHETKKFGARLITQYFNTFAMNDACFELNYFANGPGIRKMEIAQQDTETKVIWKLNDYDMNVELNMKRIKNMKVPVKLTSKSEPRFFITVNLDPNYAGRIGILGFNFTYSKCGDF